MLLVRSAIVPKLEEKRTSLEADHRLLHHLKIYRSGNRRNIDWRKEEKPDDGAA